MRLKLKKKIRVKKRKVKFHNTQIIEKVRSQSFMMRW